jgi:hypothetical protein
MNVNINMKMCINMYLFTYFVDIHEHVHSCSCTVTSHVLISMFMFMFMLMSCKSLHFLGGSVKGNMVFLYFLKPAPHRRTCCIEQPSLTLRWFPSTTMLSWHCLPWQRTWNPCTRKYYNSYGPEQPTQKPSRREGWWLPNG